MKLPLNCSVDYISDCLSKDEAEEVYSILLDHYHLDSHRIIIEAWGGLIKTDSLKILFATEKLIKQNSHREEVHGKCCAWAGQMAKLKEKVECFLNKEFELAMCLYYPDGKYYNLYQNNQETSECNTILPSISLGAIREFGFRNKTNEDVYNLNLAHGSLLVMGAHCQSRYTHSLLQNTTFTEGRINITFREPSLIEDKEEGLCH